jgi:hypothetical protein
MIEIVSFTGTLVNKEIMSKDTNSYPGGITKSLSNLAISYEFLM